MLFVLLGLVVAEKAVGVMFANFPQRELTLTVCISHGATLSAPPNLEMTVLRPVILLLDNK